MARAAGGRVFSPGVSGQGLNPFIIERRDGEELLQRIGSLRRLIEVMVGEPLGAERRAALDHVLAAYYAKPRLGRRLRRLLWLPPRAATRTWRSCCAPSPRAASATSSPTRVTTSWRRRRSSPFSTCGCWSRSCGPPRPWSARRRSGRPLPATPVRGCWWWTRSGRSCSTPRARPSWCRWRSARRKHRLGLQFITQDVQDLLSEDSSRAITGHSGRALLQNAAFKLLLQQDAAAISTVGDAFDLPQDLQRWLLSCQRGDGLLLARGNRFPIRIEATPEEQAADRMATRLSALSPHLTPSEHERNHRHATQPLHHLHSPRPGRPSSSR